MKQELLLKICNIVFAMAILVPITTSAEDFRITMRVGETIEVEGLKTTNRDGDLGPISYSWTMDSGGNRILSLSSKMSNKCKVTATATGVGCLTFNCDATIIGTGGVYPISKRYFITVEPGISVNQIKVSPSSVSLTVGETKQLSAEVLPSNAADRSVSWSTNNSSVATVSSNGLITARGAGTATITCRANDTSGTSGKCEVIVSIIPITEIRLNTTSAAMIVGDTKQLSATILPNNATNKNVTWSSDNSTVAIVSSSGLIEAKGRGSATIICKALDGSGKQATCEVSVSTVKPGVFTSKTTEGVEMKFYARNDGTCYVYGNSSSTAIDVNITGSITIPAEVEGLKVTSIASCSFYNCKGIKKVTIPSTVETIDYNAFEDCSALTNVSLGGGVKKIQNDVFKGCQSLSTITGFNNVEYIGENAFGRHIDKESIPWYENLPDGIIYLGKVLYRYKGTMPENTSVNVKEGTLHITTSAFEYCKGLVGVTIPQSVTSIGGYVLSCCPKLSSITVASGNPKYDSRNNCNAIVETEKNTIVFGCKNTIFPSTVTALKSQSFRGSGITSVVIPNNIEDITGAFYLCDSLKSVVIGKGTKTMNNNPFYRCNNMESIVVSSENPYYDSRDNSNAIIEKSTDKLITASLNTIIPKSVKAIGSNIYGYWRKIYSIVLPDNVEEVDELAFSSCFGLKSLSIGKNVKKIGKQAFGYCGALQIICSFVEYPFDIDESVFDSYNDGIYNSATLYVPVGSKINYMTSIGWGRFKNIVEFDPNVFDPIADKINSIRVDSDKDPIFSLSGQRLATPKKGINIIGKKKVVVK